MCGLDYLGNPNTHYVKRRCCHVVIPLDTYKHTNMEKSLDTRQKFNNLDRSGNSWVSAEQKGAIKASVSWENDILSLSD